MPAKDSDFAVANLGRLQHGALHHPAGIADQQHALVAGSFDRHLHALHHAHASEFLQ